MQKRLLSAIAVASLSIGLAACGGDTQEPVQESTMLTVASGGKTVAFGFSAAKGYHFVQVAPGDTVKYAGETHQQLSGSLAGSTSFSATVAGSSTFSGSAGTSSSFSGSMPTASAFTGSIGSSCNLLTICDYAARLCTALAGFDEGCDDISVGECYQVYSSPEATSAFESIFADSPELESLVCMLLDYIECVLSNSSGLDASVAVLQQCAQSSGLASLGSSDF